MDERCGKSLTKQIIVQARKRHILRSNSCLNTQGLGVVCILQELSQKVDMNIWQSRSTFFYGAQHLHPPRERMKMDVKEFHISSHLNHLIYIMADSQTEVSLHKTTPLAQEEKLAWFQLSR